MSFYAFFIRHAESVANTGVPTDDPASIPLTEAGKQQTVALAAGFPVVPAVIVSSPFLRAEQTAGPLWARFPSATRATLPIQEFTYLSPPAWRGTTAGQRRPAVEAFWERGDPHHVDGAGAESFAAFLARVEATLDWLGRQPAQPIALVCHELFIRGVLWRCLLPSAAQAVAAMRAFRVWQLTAALPNVSVTRVSCSGAGEVRISPPFPLQLGASSQGTGGRGWPGAT